MARRISVGLVSVVGVFVIVFAAFAMFPADSRSEESRDLRIRVEFRDVRPLSTVGADCAFTTPTNSAILPRIIVRDGSDAIIAIDNIEREFTGKWEVPNPPSDPGLSCRSEYIIALPESDFYQIYKNGDLVGIYEQDNLPTTIDIAVN